MSTNHFQPDTYFDLSAFTWKELFVGVDMVWDVLPKLGEFMKKISGGKKVVVGDGSTIDASVEITGSIIVGRNTHIRHAVYIRGNVIIGDNCVIGHAVELKNCIILNNTHIAHLNYVGDSIIGSNCNISGGAKLANLRFDKQPVTVAFDGEKIPTNLAKFGAVIGDHAQIGVNSVLNPGTILGKNTIVYPLQLVSGYHRLGAVIKT